MKGGAINGRKLHEIEMREALLSMTTHGRPTQDATNYMGILAGKTLRSWLQLMDHIPGHCQRGEELALLLALNGRAPLYGRAPNTPLTNSFMGYFTRIWGVLSWVWEGIRLCRGEISDFLGFSKGDVGDINGRARTNSSDCFLADIANDYFTPLIG